ncbi:type VI secretion system tube protein TssD [Tenacibaculum finnmarkense]|uniref:Uncharacterized protein n=2 Tax=Tenacibaculum finnmarkense TaxID=2781243 RepID=A0AAP1WGU4_9FLAO|nr:type VI secretion system tube protein TssD [Tenacibaculum finnmarkense]MBE7653395.1 hypothetical protein [Tenacibaculum finnmarkense genomovar finnmarkense]MBE7695751.1 hypothetical protein [Tenacibaculum finnmarkense genomovar finnmarkense]MCD8428429.1 hypothetical protein [Tenacibaculum finnmarkense genomovar finnmarkense]MCG8732294.1 hypothetical protein [Tenacibaculum finnmarkense]MCG8753009.1 hypothetical protein [Tenacibaculum finnmarkense]
MAKSELHFLGHIIDLITVETDYNKKFNEYKGTPVLYNGGGLLKFVFDFEANFRFLERMTTINYDLYKKGYPVDDGKIDFFDANDDNLKTWKFKDAPIVDYKVKFDTNGGGMRVEMILSPAIQDYGCKIHRNWHITPIKEESYQSPVQAAEKKEPKEEIIESWWSSDIEGKYKTNKASIGETAYFHIKTKNISENKELIFNLIDQGLNIVGNQEKIALNYKTNVINNKVVIDLKLNPAWDEIFANEPNIENLRVKLSWETTLNGTKKNLTYSRK